MPQSQDTAHCTRCQVDVNLQQGYHRCITEHQCFSDDPCPLQAQFAPVPARGQAQVPAQAQHSARVKPRPM